MKIIEEDIQENIVRKFSFIERLPLAIFPIIQSYVSWRDYRHLMNCNRSIVKDIKYETNHLHLITKSFNVSAAWIVDRLSESSYLHLCTKVKDPSKQISIHTSTFSEFFLYMQRPYKVKIDSCVDMKDLDFNVFNNIHHVSLAECGQVERITSGFENVKILEISMFHKLKSVNNINQSKTLDSINISFCSKCEEFNFSMDNVTTLMIWHTLVTRLPVLPKLKWFSFRSRRYIGVDILEVLRVPTIELVQIFALLPENVDVSIFQNIPDLTIYPETDSVLPSLSFSGKRLVLSGKTLTFGSSLSFEFLTKLELVNCESVINFEPMKNLTLLRLLDCLNVTMIPTLPKLCSLTISECPKLTMISPDQPSLHTLDIYKCSVNLPNVTNRIMRSLILTSSEIKGSGTIDAIKVIHVEISGCIGFSSLKQLNWQPLPQTYQGVVKLRKLNDFVDFSEIHNLHLLELHYLPHLKSCEGIHDINKVKIFFCKGFISTAGLRNIKKSLMLMGCKNLISLVDVEGIPNISISECPKIEDYSFLRKHEEVRIEGISEDKIAWLNERQKELQIKSLLITKRDREQMEFFTNAFSNQL